MTEIPWLDYKPIELTITEGHELDRGYCIYCTKPIVAGHEVTAFPIGPTDEDNAKKKVKGEKYEFNIFALHRECALNWAGFPLPEPRHDLKLENIMIEQNVKKWRSFLDHSDGPRKTIVDIGCADGQYIRAALYAGFEQVLGIDMNPDFFRSIIDWKCQYFPNRHLSLVCTRIDTPLSFLRSVLFFGAKTSVDLLKVDIEGNEYTSLVGSHMATWGPCVRYLQVETHEHHPLRPWHRVNTPDDFEKYLISSGWESNDKRVTWQKREDNE